MTWWSRILAWGKQPATREGWLIGWIIVVAAFAIIQIYLVGP
jgi:hypothetical protein